ncbi:MAG: DoxX family protein [Candidatus Bipolaricaulia bacterium]
MGAEQHVRGGVQTVQQGQSDEPTTLAKFWMLLMRVALGALVLTVGVRLLTEGGWDAWVQIGGFLPRTVEGPFAGPFLALWESPVILFLVIFGSIAVGAAMILGLFVRLAAIGGALMMITFYLSNIPPQFGWVNQQLIYFLVFALFPALGPGYHWGLDRFVRPFEERFPFLRYLTG